MRLSYIAVVILFFTQCLANGQVPFSNKDGSYKFLVTENYTHQEREIDNGTLDIQAVNDEQLRFKYALTIAKVYTDNIFSDLLKPDYRVAYLQNCGCQVLQQEMKSDPNFKGMVFTISRVDSDQLLIGCYVNTIRKNYLILYT